MVFFRCIILVSVCALFFNEIRAQDLDSDHIVCGSHYKKGMGLAASMKMVIPPNECTFLEQARKEFQIICHIAKDSVSNTYATDTSFIQMALDSLNKIFEPIDMSFVICEVDSMANTRYYQWKDFEDEPHAEIYNYLPNAINIYFCSSVAAEGELLGGYALFPGAADMLVIRCSAGEISHKSLAHQMGHFFGLFHTFETDNGVEIADGSNCSVAGDLICDTEADPGGFALECVYSAPLQDGQGNWYTPPIDNYMSYYNDVCKCEFTLQQYNRMVEMYRNERNYLW